VRGRSLLLGLFPVTCGGLGCFFLVFMMWLERGLIYVSNFQAGPAINPRPLSKRKSPKIWPKYSEKPTQSFRGRKEQLMTLKK